MRILIVDSSTQIIERLSEIISEKESIMAIDRAGSYEEAKKLFKENMHDVLLLDIQLPGNESIILLKEIKKLREKTYVVIMFTQMDYYSLEQCKSSGADLFFDKYYEFEKISGIMDAVGHGKKISNQVDFSIHF